MTDVRADTVARTQERPPVAARRFGYSVGVMVNLLLLYAVNGIGWQELSFLTPDTERVIGLVNLSLALGVLVNLVLIAADPRWLKAVGDALTTAVTTVVLVRVWQVFPFTFDDGSLWEQVARVAIGIALVGCVIALLVSFVSLARGSRQG